MLAKSLEKEAYSDIKYAVKIVKDDDNEKLLAHKAEFEILNKLSHNNVVRSIEIFNNELKSEIHQVMEFIDGSEILDEIVE